MVPLELFHAGDVYLDYPFEEMKFRYDKATDKVFARRLGKAEVEIKQSSSRFNEAISAGTVITREEYFSDDQP